TDAAVGSALLGTRATALWLIVPLRRRWTWRSQRSRYSSTPSRRRRSSAAAAASPPVLTTVAAASSPAPTADVHAARPRPTVASLQPVRQRPSTIARPGDTSGT